MFTDPLRQVATWLGDATYGVNVLRSSVPKDAGDATPAAVTIVDAATSAWVARGVIDRSKVGGGPLLLVQAANDGDALLLENGIPQSTEIEILVRFAMRKTDAAAGHVQAWLTLRAAARSLLSQAAGMSGRATRNTTQIGPVLGIRYLSLFDELQDDYVVDALLVRLSVADAWAVAGS